MPSTPGTNPHDAKPPLGRRIAVYGPSGSGKTTLGAQLGAALGLPYVELDAIFHAAANWVDLPREEFRAKVTDLLNRNSAGWVIDGNYAHVRDLVLSRADTAVWLRLPFRVVYWRLAKRTLTRASRNAELWNGNRETMRQTLFTRDSMLWWGIKTRKTSHEKIARALATIPHHANVIELHSANDVAALVRQARAQGAFAPGEPIQRV